MATKPSDRTNFVVITEKGPRRLFWVRQTNRRELIFSPRGAVSIFPDRNGLPDYSACPETLEHRKFTIHLPKVGAAVGCISFETTKGKEPLEKTVIPTTAFTKGGFALVYAYYGGSLNHERHQLSTSDGEQISLASFNQETQSVFYAIFVSHSSSEEDVELPPNFTLTKTDFEEFIVYVASIVIPVPTIGNGLSFFSVRCPQQFFCENEFIEPPGPINAYTPRDVGAFCAFQLIAMPTIVIDGVNYSDAV